MGNSLITEIIIIVLTGCAPTCIWFLFFLREDIHPEPKRVLWYTFMIGGLVSIPVLALQIIFRDLVQNLAYASFLLIGGLALIEEVFKFCAAYWAVHKNPAVDEPVDAMIYLIAAGLGFATIENVFIAINAYDANITLALTTLLSTLTLRLIGATFLHTLTSALIGYQWARGKIMKTLRSHLILGLLSATIIHAIFNALVSRYQEQNLQIGRAHV